ncbi:MAG: hypothetical protein HYV42_04110 [Candidatus Magasanikbacteria bacterium]|nr:hypothetical protein [Candidatus Magasanikbacteria bacterium]
MHPNTTHQTNLLCPECSDGSRLFRLVAIRADDEWGYRCTFRCAAERCGRRTVQVWRAVIKPADLWHPESAPPWEKNGVGEFRPFNLPSSFACPTCGLTTGPVPTAARGDPDGDPAPPPQPLPTTLHIFRSGRHRGAAIHPSCGNTLFSVAL